MTVIQNILSIAALAVVLLLNAVTIAKGVTTIVKSIQETKNATAEEKQAAKAAIKETLRKIALKWVTDAEKELGGGTGKLKSSTVAAFVYSNIPDELKPMFSADEIQQLIDEALTEAKEYWEKNQKAKEYIESGATAVLTAEVEAVKVADGIPVDEVVKAVGAGVSAAVKAAVKAAVEATQNAAPVTAPESPAETGAASEV